MAKISKLTLPVTNESTGQVTSQTFDIGGKEYIAGYGIDVDANDEISAATFVGTQAEWDALSPNVQSEYDTVNITDDFNGSNEIEVAYIETVPVSGIKDTIYGLINYNYGSDDAADGFLDDVGLFTKTPGTGSAYTYTADSVEISLNGVTYKEFASLEWDGTEFTLTYSDDTTATVTVGTAFYWRTQTNVSYFAGREKNQTMNPLGGSGAGGSVIRVLTEDASLYGRSVTASGSLFTNSAVFNNTGEAIIEGVLETGTITVHIDNGIKTKEYTVEITAYSYYELNVMMDFDYVKWLEKADIDPTEYSSLSDVFDDEPAVRKLMLKHASADFLAFNVSANLGEFDAFIANDTAMKWMGLSDYLMDKLVKIDGAESKLLASAYWTRYLKDSVPIMTSNTAPYGVASASSVYSTAGAAYAAFDANETTGWSSQNGSSVQTLTYEFTNPICPKKYRIVSQSNDYITGWKIRGSNDNSTWEDLDERTSSNKVVENFDITTDKYYKYLQLYVTASARGLASSGVIIEKLQYYGRQLSVSIPVMTSDTAPYGTAYASSVYDSGYAAYKVFDNNSSTYWCTSTLSSVSDAYVYYEFPHPIVPKFIKAVFQTSVIGSNRYKFRGSNDGSTWTDLSDEISSIGGGYFTLNNTASYKYISLWIVLQTLTTNYACGRLETLEIYGVDSSEKEYETNTSRKWIYDHGVEIEPITAFSNGTGSSATKEDSSLFGVRAAVTNGYFEFDTESPINLSSYSFIKMTIGSQMTAITEHGLYAVKGSKTQPFGLISVSDLDSYKCFIVADLPSKYYMNISSLNTTSYLSVRYAGSAAGNAGIIEVAELWLE